MSVNYDAKKDRTCEFCGEENAKYRIDPFIEEIYGETVERWLCDDCYRARIDDI